MRTLARLLLQQWFRPQPGLLARMLQPLAVLYAMLQGLDRRRRERRAQALPQVPVPVVVVGNVLVGGAGKTPTTIALVQALQQAGWHPGVVSRGYGRNGGGLRTVHAQACAQDVGDEPLLVHRRTAAPMQVGRDRRAAALALLQAHPEVDVVVADDGLQHRELRRNLEIVVFDERGLGNGRLLPAGPLREPLPHAAEPQMLVLYNHARASTAWPGACAERRLGAATPLPAWLAGRSEGAQALASLRGRRLLALAGIAVPERFFAALEAAGLTIDRLPLPDHHAYDGPAPWPAHVREIVTTEKDAVKLQRHAQGSGPTIWVVGLDLLLPTAFTAELLARLEQARGPACPEARTDP